MLWPMRSSNTRAIILYVRRVVMPPENLAHVFAGVIAAKEKEVASSFLKMESAVYDQIGPKDKI